MIDGTVVRAHQHAAGAQKSGRSSARAFTTLYVTNGMSDDMSLVDTAKMKSFKTVKAGRVPHSVVVDD